ncbi:MULTISPECIES: hypothetical protein [unclassified Sphingomonas]|uniref:hypothetical protein n=1 Tax=unclassified Sphingomonas TaxID=196159 RepID=UPI0010F72ADC|nr:MULTISPECIES: hypothetical protein [unclassified Sphingomonas]
MKFLRNRDFYRVRDVHHIQDKGRVAPEPEGFARIISRTSSIGCVETVTPTANAAKSTGPAALAAGPLLSLLSLSPWAGLHATTATSALDPRGGGGMEAAALCSAARRPPKSNVGENCLFSELR